VNQNGSRHEEAEYVWLLTSVASVCRPSSQVGQVFQRSLLFLLQPFHHQRHQWSQCQPWCKRVCSAKLVFRSCTRAKARAEGSFLGKRPEKHATAVLAASPTTSPVKPIMTGPAEDGKPAAEMLRIVERSNSGSSAAKPDFSKPAVASQKPTGSCWIFASI